MMAVVSATSNGADENLVEIKEDKKGWLSKRTHFTHRWKRAWFQLKETILFYGENEEKLLKPINLVGAVVEVVEGGDGSFEWTITPKDRKRTFFLKAGTIAEQQGWMEAICEAQLSSRDHATNACVVQ
uniref:pleckstrin homology-like domain-containing protein n=1 Tax=Oncorhynchus gorbuscha TaxID=8017 RepID=UPI001EAF42F7|nr:pleckstrin homology-like domain-containing protein [Oncorhynchus gorbuscha]